MYPELVKSITAALDWCKSEGIDIPLDIQLKARQYGALKASGDVAGISADYHDRITAALLTYLEGGSVTGPRNAFRQAAVEALGDAFDLGFSDAGGALPLEGDALEWLNARIEQELAHIGTIFEQAKQLRKDEDADILPWVNARADGYTRTVMALYNAGGMYAKKNQMLVWRLGATEKHCRDCLKLNGKAHRASWYLAHNYIPRQPGSSTECFGIHCDCRLEDKDGKEVTI